MSVNYELSDTITVAEIDECHASKLSAFLHPTGQCDCLAYIFNAELSAGVCCVHICLVVYFRLKSDKNSQINLNIIILTHTTFHPYAKMTDLREMSPSIKSVIHEKG